MIDISELRLPPHHQEAEMGLLSCIIMDSDKMYEIDLKAEDFYFPAHRDIFRAMKELTATDKHLDVVTLSDQLGEKLDYIGGQDYLYELAGFAITTAATQDYARIIGDKSRRRKIQTCFTRANGMMMGSDKSLEEILAEVYKAMSEDEKGSEEFKLVMDSIMRMSEDEQEAVVICPLGYKELDRFISGYEEGSMYIVAGRPSMGKSILLMNLMERAMLCGVKCVFFSVETSNVKVSNRFISFATGISVEEVKARTDRVKEEVVGALGKYDTDAVVYDNVPNFQYIVNKMRKEASLGAKIVYIDYLQLITNDQYTGPREDLKIASMTKQLVRLAKELKMCVVLASQLNRDVEKRVDNRPKIGDLRESGAIEQDADIVILLHDPSKYDIYADEKDLLQLIVAKNRDGVTDTAKLLKEYKYFRLKDRE